jgi:hypothetical protein
LSTHLHLGLLSGPLTFWLSLMFILTLTNSAFLMLQ